ncbi:hypothetical protein FSP39_011378 [Pinctada imbricata]|uniref:Clr5 domain-containing protein n=1 Tax=Pinctada imbricata TaxID=66713 RepID=A0AA88Y3C8_PINIB|nr:hypothetical protein FSP39_011378 [Pinctada imbricata]
MDDIRDNLIEQYFGQGLKYAEIVHVLKHDHGMSLSLRHVKRILQKLHLERRKYSDIRNVVDFIYVQLQSSGQLHGYRIMHEKCRQNGFNVKMNDVRLILKQLDPVGVEHRTARRLGESSYSDTFYSDSIYFDSICFDTFYSDSIYSDTFYSDNIYSDSIYSDTFYSDIPLG